MSLKTSEIKVLAKRYATALFQSVGGKSSDLDKVSNELDSLLELSSKDESFAKLINSPIFSKEDNLNAVEKIAKKAGFSKNTTNLLLVLAANSRLQILPEVCRAFKIIVMEDKGLLKAEVVSAKKLGSTEIKNITDSISKATGKKVECENLIDSSIIGGLKVKIGSKLVDNSISGRLERLKVHLAGNL